MTRWNEQLLRINKAQKKRARVPEYSFEKRLGIDIIISKYNYYKFNPIWCKEPRE
jgi:hypothetical protein